MIEFIEVMFRALTGLKLTFPTLISLAVFFAAGYYFAATTKLMGPLKVILALFLAYILSTVLSGMLGIYTLAVVIGFLSNQGVFLARVLFWVENLAEFIFVMRHRMAYEDIRREESRSQSEPEAPRSRPNQSKPRQEEKAQQKSRADSGTRSRSGSNADWKPGPGKSKSDIDRCLRILELEVGGTYEQKQIKKAYRRLAMIHHPDLPTGNHEAFVRLGMASEYLLKHLEA